MYFFLSIFYFVTYYLTPATIFGPLAPLHLEMVLAIVILAVSIPKLGHSPIFQTPQTIALLGLATAVFLSVLISVRWMGGAVHDLLEFIPSIFAFFLLYLHCDSRKKLKVLVLMMLFVALFVMAHGVFDLYFGVPPSGPPISQDTGSLDVKLWNVQHGYLLPMRNDTGGWIYRIRGLGAINDPNDFGQFLVCVIPLMSILWRKKKALRNLAFVVVPVCILLFGVYLTHSRGALLALTAVALISARRRFGLIPGVILAGCLLAGAMALQFTGGRQISLQSGADRSDLWSAGLTLFREHPLFGVGYNRFMQYESNTAHNSVVVCAAEVGFIGFYFWSLFLFSTAQSAAVIASPRKIGDSLPMRVEHGPYQSPSREADVLDKDEVNRIGRALVSSLAGFLVAGWFLSRAFVMSFFLLGGMIEAVYEMARVRGMTPPRMSLPRVLVWGFGLSVFLLSVVYMSLRVINLIR